MKFIVLPNIFSVKFHMAVARATWSFCAQNSQRRHAPSWHDQVGGLKTTRGDATKRCYRWHGMTWYDMVWLWYGYLRHHSFFLAKPRKKEELCELLTCAENEYTVNGCLAGDVMWSACHGRSRRCWLGKDSEQHANTSVPISTRLIFVLVFL